MNDRRNPPSGEEELVRRAREGSGSTADDDPALRAATRWLDHVDAAVSRTDSLRPEDGRDDRDLEADRRLRAGVLESLGRAEAPPPSRLPWWRVWAPVTVAALLLGLFTLREVERVGPAATPTAPARQDERESVPLRDTAPPLASPRVPPPEPALRSEARRLDGAAESSARENRPEALASPSASAEGKGFQTPVSAQAESLLSELARLPGPDPARTDSIRAALETLRPRLEDDSLRRRVDRVLGSPR